MIKTIEEFISLFNNSLNNLSKLITDIEPIKEASIYSVMNGGKRIRPKLVFLGAMSVANEVEYKDIENLALGIELIHSYSLVHDDLPSMDNDSLRRGLPTTHVKYGVGMATLAGDALLNLAFEIMLKNIENLDANELKKQVLAAKYIVNNSGINGMVGGQCLDLKNDQVNTIDIKDLNLINSLKTGALIKGALLAGAIRYGANKEQIKALEEYSEYLGLLFQVVDDILDVTSTKEVLGKDVHQDEKNEKPTYVKLVGLDQSYEDCKIFANKAIECIEIANITNKKLLIELIDKMLKRVN